MKKLLAIATVLSLAVSGAALANTTAKTEHVNHGVKTHEVAKAEHSKKELKKSEVKQTGEVKAPEAAKAGK
ncbi:TPA: acid-shock protein [Providencia alcalifaciens]